MFESTGWQLEEPEFTETTRLRPLQALTIVRPSVVNPRNEKMEILQQYQFSSTLQRMSVIARSSLTGNFLAFTKGSPEMILSLSTPESIPNNVMLTLKHFTEQGYRVIAVACKDIDVDVEQVSDDFLTSAERVISI
jgi:magnesium-transporting ATPase (P-type)